MAKPKRILSGVKSSGELTLGNYLGAMKPWAKIQDEGHDSFYFVPDLHVLNMPYMQRNPAVINNLTYDTVAWLLAVGISPKKSTIFVQSHVPAHSELSWILENYVYFGELGRMTQFKDKSRKQGKDGIPASLFTYPVLMAADILLYGAHEVPVGEDQIQHVELARDIAERFNTLYGKTLRVPKGSLPKQAARIMNLADPTSKMSKSDEDNRGNILLSDDIELIKKKIKSATTDSHNKIAYRQKNPGVTNLIEIIAASRDQKPEEVASSIAGGYKELKETAAEAVIEVVQPLQQRFDEYRKDEPLLRDVMHAGAEAANLVANKTLHDVRKKIGLVILA